MNCIDQTDFTPEGGNCFSACIASLLEVPLEDIPNWRLTHGDDMIAEARLWLYERDITLLGVDRNAFRCAPTLCIAAVDGPLMAPREDGGAMREIGHAVIGMVGTYTFEVIHDPNPNIRGQRDYKPIQLYFLIRGD